MERYSLIVVTDETSPIRRFEVRKDRVRQAAIAVAVAACLFALGLVDYVRVRADQGELHALQQENAAQRARITAFGETLAAVENNLERLRDFERKVRIIANLPGSAASGGDDVFAVGTATTGDLEAASEAAQAVDAAEGSQAATPLESTSSDDPAAQTGAAEGAAEDAAGARSPGARAPRTPGAVDRVSVLQRDAERLGLIAADRELSLAELLDALEDKRHHLASTPAIWPAKGWMTSRFGNRISPFTGAKQFHSGIDIAGARGTDVIAPARGRVTFAGKQGALGRAVKIDHGYGIRTLYGHNDEIFVKRGQQVERGQKIARLGSSGRSTGPHLHYVVEVRGKAVNPLNYIFD